MESNSQNRLDNRGKKLRKISARYLGYNKKMIFFLLFIFYVLPARVLNTVTYTIIRAFRLTIQVQDFHSNNVSVISLEKMVIF